MNCKMFYTHSAIDAKKLNVRHWSPSTAEVKGVIQFIHGLGEHSGRYEEAADHWTQAGFAVIIADCRGHGLTSEPSTDPLGHIADHYGWQLMVSDAHHINAITREHYPNLPLILGGHSTGTLTVIKFLLEHPSYADACCLVSPVFNRPILYSIARHILKIEKFRLPKRKPSKLILNMLHEWLSLGIKTQRTAFDWLNQNPQAIDSLLTDPMCAITPSVQTWLDLLAGFKDVSQLGGLSRLPQDLAYYVIAGAEDPINQDLLGNSLEQAVQKAALPNMQLNIYPDGRHDMLQELDRAIIYEDLTRWLTSLTKSSASKKAA